AVYDAFIPRRIFSVNQFTFLVDGSLPMGRQHARFYEISVNPSPDACTPSCASRPMILAPQRWRLPCKTGSECSLGFAEPNIETETSVRIPPTKRTHQNMPGRPPAL